MIKIIGAGLAGCEAAWQAAESGEQVLLYEQKPLKYSPAHKNKDFAELVCSNSLRAEGLSNAVGLLKEEMRLLGSLIMQCADATRVPAGGALAVDRDGFSRMVTERIRSHKNIEVMNEEVHSVTRSGITIIATGPLTEGSLIDNMVDRLHFFDAAAPIVNVDSLDSDKMYRKARYDKGGADYLNCPMTKDEYIAFYNALVSAEVVEMKDFEANYFEGCMPVEILATRGEDTLRFGPLKPIGLETSDGNRPYAVVQLRQDNAAATLYNLVGFQTRLKFAEQERVFRMIPGLENAEFERFGVMHRNTYINSPGFLSDNYSVIHQPDIFFAGQITGVEGYLESASSGLIAGRAAVRRPIPRGNQTAIGALAYYVANASQKHFQPMNVNFGIIAPLDERVKDKKLKNEMISKRAIEEIKCLI